MEGQRAMDGQWPHLMSVVVRDIEGEQHAIDLGAEECLGPGWREILLLLAF